MKTGSEELNGVYLYTPKGAAREYAAVGCNFYVGCPLQCDYCYNRKGVTCNTLGSPEIRLKTGGKKWIEDESDAILQFCEEVFKNIDYLQKTGVFYSFTTDPMLPGTRGLTAFTAGLVASAGVPVKILTKMGDFGEQTEDLLVLDEELKERIAFGFTLTGRDDFEKNAAELYHSSNEDRLALMKRLHDAGFKTFASIEPIIDFDSSMKMIKRSVTFCDQYLIGLMSKRGKELPPYEKEECSKFVDDVDDLIWDSYYQKQTPELVRVYWKESIRKFMWDDDCAWISFDLSPTSVGRDWSLFTKQDIEL